jgi:hypothetical protein
VAGELMAAGALQSATKIPSSLPQSGDDEAHGDRSTWRQLSPQNATAPMPRDPETDPRRSYRNLLIVVVLVLAAWAFVIVGALVLIELRH